MFQLAVKKSLISPSFFEAHWEIRYPYPMMKAGDNFPPDRVPRVPML